MNRSPKYFFHQLKTQIIDSRTQNRRVGHKNKNYLSKKDITITKTRTTNMTKDFIAALFASLWLERRRRKRMEFNNFSVTLQFGPIKVIYLSLLLPKLVFLSVIWSIFWQISSGNKFSSVFWCSPKKVFEKREEYLSCRSQFTDIFQFFQSKAAKWTKSYKEARNVVFVGTFSSPFKQF